MMTGPLHRRRPRPPGLYVRVVLTRPITTPFGGSHERLLMIESEFTDIKELEDGALMVTARWPKGRIETFHFPKSSINYWSTYRVHQSDYDREVAEDAAAAQILLDQIAGGR